MRLTIRVQGVGRVADNDRVLLVSFSERPTDDEMRELHDYLRVLYNGEVKWQKPSK